MPAVEEQAGSPQQPRQFDLQWGRESKLLLSIELNRLLERIMEQPSDLVARAQLGVALQAKSQPVLAKQQYEEVLHRSQESEMNGNDIEARARKHAVPGGHLRIVEERRHR